MSEKKVIYDIDHIKYYSYTKRRRLVQPVKHTHGFWEIVYLLNGSFINNVNGTKVKMGYTDVVIIRPNDTHFYDKFSEDIDYRDIYVSCEEMKYICDLLSPTFFEEISRPALPIMFKLDSVHLCSIEKSISFFDRMTVRDEKYKTLFNNLVSRILGMYCESIATSELENVQPQFFSSVLRFIDERPLEVDCDIVINKLGYSQSHVNRLFIKYTGESLSKYILSSKMRYAAERLLNNELTVMQISSEIGYANQSNFDKAFKKIYGVSPMRWRKR